MTEQILKRFANIFKEVVAVAYQLAGTDDAPSQLVSRQRVYIERKIYYDKNQLYECRNLQP